MPFLICLKELSVMIIAIIELEVNLWSRPLIHGIDVAPRARPPTGNWFLLKHGPSQLGNNEPIIFFDILDDLREPLEFSLQCIDSNKPQYPKRTDEKKDENNRSDHFRAL